MKRFSIALHFTAFLGHAAIWPGPLSAQQLQRTLFEDEFNDLASWQDMSLVPRWGNPAATRSAFSILNGQVAMTSTAVSFSGYTNSNHLKTFTCLDHRFESPVDRAAEGLALEWRMYWPSLNNGGKGESGRVVITINHEYPENGLDLTPEGAVGTKLTDFSQPWWARPAYQVRLRDGNDGPSRTIMMYGGGADPEGEYESYKSGTTPVWWLPGFIAAAPPHSTPDDPANPAEFPVNSWTLSKLGLATTTPLTFRYVIKPHQQELWRDDNDNGFLEAPAELKVVMPTPRTHATAPIYRYFPRLEGVRIYWRGASNLNYQAVFDYFDAWTESGYLVDWDIDATTSGAQGGAGHWNYFSPIWDASTATAGQWVDSRAAILRLGAPGGTIQMGLPSPTAFKVAFAPDQISLTSNQLILTAEKNYGGAAVRFTSGKNNGQERLIASHDTAAGRITLDRELPDIPALNDSFTINPPLQAGGLTTESEGYVLSFHNAGNNLTGEGDTLLLSGSLTGPVEARFYGQDKYTGSLLDYPEQIDTTGLRFVADEPVTYRCDARLTYSGTYDSATLGIDGPATVEFHGSIVSKQQGFHWISFTGQGGKLYLAADAQIDTIQPQWLYTRQIWIKGNGGGTVEIDPDFVADQTQGGTVDRGMGSLRLSRATLITHHTQSLPLTYRSYGSGVQTNGHLVFEDMDGAVWSVRSQPQTFSGAFWAFMGGTVETLADLTHDGVTQYAPDIGGGGAYTAYNAFQIITAGKVLRKTGPARLRLAGDQAYATDTRLIVEAGTLEMTTDPSAGRLRGQSSAAGPNLHLEIAGSASAELRANLHRLATLESQGQLTLAGHLQSSADFTLGQNSQCLWEVGSGVVQTGALRVGGQLVLRRANGYRPAAGTVLEWTGSRSGTFSEVVDESGLGFTVEYLAGGVRFTTTTEATELRYAEWTAGEGLSGVEASAEATPAGDGVPNLWKYYLGWPARTPASAQVGDWWTDAELGRVYRIIHPLERSEATLTAYRSDDLQTWVEVEPGEIRSIVDPNNPTRVWLRLVPAIPETDQAAFWRFRLRQGK